MAMGSAISKLSAIVQPTGKYKKYMARFKYVSKSDFNSHRLHFAWLGNHD